MPRRFGLPAARCRMTGYVRYDARPNISPASLGQLDIELTERCNNNCIHCCINLSSADAAARQREMTTAQVKDILDQAAHLGALQVRFTGGEPLLRPDFEELYIYARYLGLKVILFTNATLITPHLADVLAHIPPRAPIEITVYGMRPESYEAVTRLPGSFAKFRRGVDLLLEHGVYFIIKAALLPPNRGEIDELEAWAKSLPGMKTPPRYSMFFDLRGRRDDPQKNALIKSLRISPQEGLAILSRDETAYRRENAEFSARFMGPGGDRLFNCGACSGHGACVDAYGRAQPCLSLRAQQFSVPVVAQNQSDSNSSSGTMTCLSLAEALNRFKQLDQVRTTNIEYLRRCAVCSIKGFCEQCPAKSWAESGTLDTPVEYLCQVAHTQARSLGWLGENEYAWEKGLKL
jgi:MoaA/NifB/PqqE/SkfB family radical SAM enzyme